MSNRPRAVLYTRISEDEPNYDKPAVQMRNLRALAKSFDYVVVDQFEDRVSAFANSRGELKDRPGFNALTAGVAAGKYDVVLAIHKDRISRDGAVAAVFGRLCQKHGVKIHTKTMGVLDMDDPMDRAMSGVIDVFSELDVAIRIGKQIDRFEDEVSNGRPLWGVRPFGYDADPDALPGRNGKKSKRWTVPHETEAEEVRRAYDIILGRVEGTPSTVYSILKGWNERGILTTRGKQWAYASVRQLLLRPRNAGIVVRRDEVQEGVEAQWEPLVSREDYESVVAILSDPKRATAPGRKPTYLLASIARCGVCGAAMRSGIGNGEAIYKCEAKSNARALGERHAAIAARLIEPLVRDAVVSAFMFAPADLLPGEHVNLVPIDADLAKVRASRAKIIKLISQDLISEGEAAKELSELKSREASLTADRDELARSSARASMLVDLRNNVVGNDHRVALGAAVEVKAALRERFDSFDLNRRRELVRAFVDVTVNPGRRIERVQVTHKIVTTLNDASAA